MNQWIQERIRQWWRPTLLLTLLLGTSLWLMRPDGHSSRQDADEGFGDEVGQVRLDASSERAVILVPIGLDAVDPLGRLVAVRSIAATIQETHAEGPRSKAWWWLMRQVADSDFRVRQEAIRHLDQVSPWPGAPLLRDTPMAEREVRLMAWLDTVPPDERPRGDEWCDLFVRAEQLRFGPTLQTICASCHLGPKPPARLADDQCARCHESAHASFVGSAHALTTTHLPLATVDPEQRATTLVAWERRGLSCVACHEPVESERSNGINQHADGGGGAADTALVSESSCLTAWSGDLMARCVSCHTSTAREWERWQAEPRWVHESWPVARWVMSDRADAPTCVTCHTDGDHAMAARRNDELLRSSIGVVRGNEFSTLKSLADLDGAMLPAEDGAALKLINLAGHSLPTGTRRHALVIRVGSDDAIAHGLGRGGPALPLTDSPETREGESLFFNGPAWIHGEASPAEFSLDADVWRSGVTFEYHRWREGRESTQRPFWRSSQH